MSLLHNKEEIISLFERNFGKCVAIERLRGGGSNREYYRLRSDSVSIIGVYGCDIRENDIFVRLDNLLAQEGINVPGVIAFSPDKKYYLLEDLGDIQLMSLLKLENGKEYARKALGELIKMQLIPEKKWADLVGFPPFSERLVRWDLNYFKYDFLKPSGIIFDEEKLEDDFDLMLNHLTSKGIISGFMYRDFQSRNIMVKDGSLYFIDFQGARKGPVVYDAVSFIWQAKAPFSYSEREELEEYYITRYGSCISEQRIKSCKTATEIEDIARNEGGGENKTEESLRSQMELISVFRTLQVLGAYGFRGLIEKKPHFIESIPYAIRNLKYLGSKGRLKLFPEIERISGILYEEYEKVSKIEKHEKTNLTLTVNSFSYKKGYPEDKSGNGGGFMFDCRGLHNPGRYEEYKHKTGRDKEVIEFLEAEKETSKFVERAIKIVEPSVRRYIERGFTSLQVGFGCTGGQHRSVYCSEKFAHTIKEKYPGVTVRLIHREQEIEENL
ncbi:MAG: phosphotransferase [Muribaculaceae bacterium]|nr:phosphotransferase [Muribaculaceae bacterium]